MRNFLAILFLFVCLGSKGQGLTADSLDKLLRAGLSYLEQQQQDTTIEGLFYRGEWPTYMQMRRRFILLGSQGKVYDSNCFALAGIFNILADIYLRDSTQKNILPMLDKAYPQLMSYNHEDGFNFWPLLLPDGRVSWFKPNKPGVKVRRPVQFRIFNAYIRRAANVMNDNDDSAQGMLSAWLYQQVRPGQLQVTPKFSGFDQFRDTLRFNLHYYNLLARDKRNSGAFLTWRGHEDHFNGRNVPKLLLNNALFLFPVSTCFPEPYTSYMPYGANDMDAVVNANVLTTLSRTSTHSKGRKGAVSFIQYKIEREMWSRAGVYYPNRYHLHYAVVRAWKSGISELEPSVTLLKKHLTESQQKDGSYRSRSIVNRKDVIQSTAYALNAMLRMGDPAKTGLQNQVEGAFRFLMQNAHYSEKDLCWDGGVFFSGGTVIRNTLYWKSDAYTTAIILEALSYWKSHLRNK